MLRPVSEYDHYSFNAVKLCHALVRFALESRMTEMYVNQPEADSLQTVEKLSAVSIKLPLRQTLSPLIDILDSAASGTRTANSVSLS